METRRLRWEELPTAVRTAVQDRTGPVFGAQTMVSGNNNAVAAWLRTARGEVFVKGLPRAHPQFWAQQREAELGAHVAPIGPRLLWRVEAGGWSLLGFEYIAGRQACYAPGSPDLLLLAQTLTELADRPLPPVALEPVEWRWAEYMGESADLQRFAGDTLVHTDLNPANVLITGERSYLVDWVWAGRGAVWLDAAIAVIWLLASELHTPASAEAWAARMPAWHQAPARSLDAFAAANAVKWGEIAAREDWAHGLCRSSRLWAAHRSR
ncbi:Phosphotransferase enzyme family protein [Streptomyces sp. 2231.1]|uniref:phosphotransferase n=1 Tax=Streptomyces sp. 2231.1 TaxID=1855347 RepID=UPI000898533A|nr:phosphotransferase [Streptomyces sp. 2231.1]SEC09911.1 Phosphotransferase enzyme family protein [Streptomyces sp. 2231.1]